MTTYWTGGAPGILRADAFVEVIGENPPERPPTGTPVAVRDAATGTVLTSFLDEAGAPTSSIDTLAAGYLCFGVEDVPVVEISADGWATITRLVMLTAITEAITAADAALGLGAVLGVRVTDYVKGDGTDEGASLQSAVNTAVATKRPLICDGSLLVLTSTSIDMRAAALIVIGNGMRIRVTASNTVGVRVGGARQVITGLTVDYAATPTTSHTDSTAWELYAAVESLYESLHAERTARGWRLAQSGWAGASSNTAINCAFSNVTVRGFAISALDMRSWPASATASNGCTWTNTRLRNDYSGSVLESSQSPVQFADWETVSLRGLNIERADLAAGVDLITLTRAQNVVSDELHVEAVTLDGTAGLIRATDSTTATIRGLSFVNSTLPAETARKSILRLGQGVSGAPLRVSVDGLRMRSITTSGATAFALVDLDSDVTTGRVTLDRADTAALIGAAVVGDWPAAPIVQRINDRLFGALAGDRDRLAGGQATMPRGQVGSADAGALATQTLRLSFFTAEDDRLITQMRLLGGSVAAGATPTLIRAGLYTVAKNGDLALVAAIASDTTLFATANATYVRALSTTGGLPSSYQIVAGQRYALGLLVVTAATAPTVPGQVISTAMTNEGALTPRLCASVTGQTALPTSVASASLVASAVRPYGVVLP